ncbi:MAG: class I SAM-dependent methyltransferase [Bacteroidetes bacterium]|nr:class I SAM-dependent methyltransferase [Bacteroidota bacterium]
MDYDPIKNRFGDLIAQRPWLTRLFYAALQLFFLRNWYVRRELNRVIRQDSNRENLRVLDAGTGFGQFSFYLAKKFPGLLIEAIDVKDEYLERAKHFFDSQGLSGRVSFAKDDLTDLQASGPFDIILSVDVMEHIEDDEQVFRNFKSVLAPRGLVIINTPSDLGGSDTSGTDEQSFIGEHVRDGYNKDDLSEKLLSAGLLPTEMIYTYGVFGDIAWRLLIKFPMLLLRASKYLVVLLPFYYVPILPIGILLNLLDLRSDNEEGTGLLVVAENSAN